MARLFLDRESLTEYKDRLFKGTMSDYLEALQTSSTLYVGNVSFFTSEEQIDQEIARLEFKMHTESMALKDLLGIPIGSYRIL